MANGQNVAYKRVSTIQQKTDRQLLDVNIEFDKIFEDRLSGATVKNRPQLQACLEHCRGGDTLHVHSFDRLARNSIELQLLIKDLNERGVKVVFYHPYTEFGGDANPQSKLFLQLMAAIAEFERALINERTNEGRALAQQKGTRFGRKECKQYNDIIELLKKGKHTPTEISRELEVSRTTVYRIIGDLKKEKKIKKEIKQIKQKKKKISIPDLAKQFGVSQATVKYVKQIVKKAV